MEVIYNVRSTVDGTRLLRIRDTIASNRGGSIEQYSVPQSRDELRSYSYCPLL